MPRRAPIVLAACLTALAPGLAAAQGPTEPADFTPTYEEQLLGFEDATIDTGWIPNNSPVQMRFYADAANSIIIDLPGTAYYDWQTEELRFEGDPMAGFFEYDIGLELVASVKVDVSLAQWQSELLGPYDWGVQAATMFTPYLLEGNPDRPAMIQDQSGAFDLVSIPLIPDIIIISGDLDIALYVDIEATLHCNRIEVLGPDAAITTFTQEGESNWIDPGEGPDALVLPATAYCQLQTQPTLIINPHLQVSVLFDDYDIAGIDIPVDLPVIDDEIMFETIELSFPFWEDPPPEPGDGDGDGDGETDGGTDEDTGDETDGGETGTGDAGIVGVGDEGCNCSTAPGSRPDPARGLGWTALALLGLAAIRRRG